MRIIVYGSCYGSARRYAAELAKRTGIEMKSYEEVQDISDYRTIIYIGALYAGGVLGMARTLGKLADSANKKIVIATVGLSDPHDIRNTDAIEAGMKRQLSSDVYERAVFYHLRGAIDYSRLHFKHRVMMGLLYKKAISLPEEKKTAEVRAMIETYNKKVDFLDLTCLDGIYRECMEC